MPFRNILLKRTLFSPGLYCPSVSTSTTKSTIFFCECCPNKTASQYSIKATFQSNPITSTERSIWIRSHDRLPKRSPPCATTKFCIRLRSVLCTCQQRHISTKLATASSSFTSQSPSSFCSAPELPYLSTKAIPYPAKKTSNIPKTTKKLQRNVCIYVSLAIWLVCNLIYAYKI